MVRANLPAFTLLGLAAASGLAASGGNPTGRPPTQDVRQHAECLPDGRNQRAGTVAPPNAVPTENAAKNARREGKDVDTLGEPSGQEGMAVGKCATAKGAGPETAPDQQTGARDQSDQSTTS